MSLTGDQLGDKSSDTEENSETEGDSDESVQQSITKLKNISLEKKTGRLFSRRNYRKKHAGRLNVSIRNSKHGRQYATKSKCLKRKTGKKCVQECQDCPEKTAEVPQKGKRCRQGGKAKAKPPEEERCDKNDSDEDADSFYCSRVSLGYFQKFRDDSGASTSYQLDESYGRPNLLLPKTENLTNKTSEELELLELQQWGMSSTALFKNRREKLNRTDDIRPDTF